MGVYIGLPLFGGTMIYLKCCFVGLQTVNDVRANDMILRYVSLN